MLCFDLRHSHSYWYRHYRQPSHTHTHTDSLALFEQTSACPRTDSDSGEEANEEGQAAIASSNLADGNAVLPVVGVSHRQGMDSKQAQDLIKYYQTSRHL